MAEKTNKNAPVKVAEQSPEKKQQKAPEKEKKRKISIFMIFNILSLLLFIASTVTSFMKSSETSPYRPFVIIALVIFVITFGLVIILTLNDKRKFKKATGEYKYAVKTTKNTIAIIKKIMFLINLVTATLIALDAAGDSGIRRIVAIATCVVSGGMAVFYIIIKLIKILKGGIKLKRKQKKAEKKAREEEEKQAQKEIKKEQQAAKKAETQAKLNEMKEKMKLPSKKK